MFEPMELTNDAVIKVIGVGGGGGNAVEHMVRERIEGVEFFAVNTDAQALRKTAVGQTIQIGSGITKGLGAGANPEVGRNAADEDREALRAALDGADMVFIAGRHGRRYRYRRGARSRGSGEGSGDPHRCGGH